MQCERLIGLAKSWYTSVRNETMAPARMVQFIKQHVAGCPVCKEDPDIKDEIVKITEVILPDSKIPKAVRMKKEQEDAARREAEEAEADEADDDDDTDENEDEDEDFVDDIEEDEAPLSEEEEL
ncbi:MAG: hypothetical protein V2I35_06455 [Desulfocapsaceae bacterium]|jgi:hypothetical protein|nr:hypothetical protein [Desulfocapsaceae bacterium]